jgi:hypothetical protein
MKRSYIISIGLIVLTIGIFFAQNANEFSQVGESEMTKKRLESPDSSLTAENVQDRQAQTAPIEKSDEALTPISPIEVDRLRQSIATKELVKNEVQSNPHGAPRAIIHFAEILGQMMGKALNNESDAKTLIDELQECALTESADVTIRALCVSNAEKLSTAHNQLKWRSDKIRDSVPANILEMADARKILNKNGVKK